MSRLRLVVIAVAAALAVVLALVGLAVLGTSARLHEDARTLAAGVVDPNPDVGDRSIADRIGDAFIGTGGTRDYLEAVALARASTLEGQNDAAVLEQRAQAEAILSRLVGGDGERLMRSRAANLLGVLLFEDAKVAKASPRRYLEQSLAAFQDAATLDPSYSTAKANLELLQELPLRTSFRDEGTSGSDASSGGSGESGY